MPHNRIPLLGLVLLALAASASLMHGIITDARRTHHFQAA